MAHFPRWIDNDLVDSAAMFSAYMEFLDACAPTDFPPFVHHLYTVDHRHVYIPGVEEVHPAVHGIVIPSRACLRTPCRRCETLSGGYQFRWFSLDWYPGYLRRARPGAWTLCELDPKVAIDKLLEANSDDKEKQSTNSSDSKEKKVSTLVNFVAAGKEGKGDNMNRDD